VGCRVYGSTLHQTWQKQWEERPKTVGDVLKAMHDEPPGPDEAHDHDHDHDDTHDGNERVYHLQEVEKPGQPGVGDDKAGQGSGPSLVDEAAATPGNGNGNGTAAAPGDGEVRAGLSGNGEGGQLPSSSEAGAAGAAATTAAAVTPPAPGAGECVGGSGAESVTGALNECPSAVGAEAQGTAASAHSSPSSPPPPSQDDVVRTEAPSNASTVKGTGQSTGKAAPEPPRESGRGATAAAGAGAGEGEAGASPPGASEKSDAPAVDTVATPPVEGGPGAQGRGEAQPAIPPPTSGPTLPTGGSVSAASSPPSPSASEPETGGAVSTASGGLAAVPGEASIILSSDGGVVVVARPAAPAPAPTPASDGGAGGAGPSPPNNASVPLLPPGRGREANGTEGLGAGAEGEGAGRDEGSPGSGGQGAAGEAAVPATPPPPPTAAPSAAGAVGASGPGVQAGGRGDVTSGVPPPGPANPPAPGTSTSPGTATTTAGAGVQRQPRQSRGGGGGGGVGLGLDLPSFADFKKLKLAKVREDEERNNKGPGSGLGPEGPMGNIFRTLMHEITALEINQTIFDLYLTQLHTGIGYALAEGRQEREKDQANTQVALARLEQTVLNLSRANQELAGTVGTLQDRLYLSAACWILSLCGLILLAITWCVGGAGGRKGAL
jgi:hypothetical protein